MNQPDTRTLSTEPKGSPDLKAKWLEALRSGKYQQAHGTLKDIHGAMCCLGVACDIIDPGAWNIAPTKHDDTEGFGWNDNSPAYVTAPIRHLGITSNQAMMLAKMNDGNEHYRRHSFAEIADWIEANL